MPKTKVDLRQFESEVAQESELDNYLLKAEVVTTAAANKILRLNTDGRLPADITGNAGTATNLRTARSIAITGDASGSANFDGTANISINATLANSGVSAGNYDLITVDSKGRITAGYHFTHGAQSWDTAGTYIFTVPTNTYYLLIEFLIGGGGGGGGASSSSKFGGNGGMGQIMFNRVVAVTPGQQLAIIIGTGGTGGASGKAGAAGGLSTFGGLLTTIGGSGGPFWNASTGSPGADGGPNESPFLSTVFDNGGYGIGKTGSSGAGTAGKQGYCAIRW